MVLSGIVVAEVELFRRPGTCGGESALSRDVDEAVVIVSVNMVGARVGLTEPLPLLYDSPRWSLERDRQLSSEGATMVVSKVYQSSLSLTRLA